MNGLHAPITLRVARADPPNRAPPCRHVIILLHDKGSNGLEFRRAFLSAQTTETAGAPQTLDRLYDCCSWVFPYAPFPDADRPDRHQWFGTRDMGNPQDTPDHEQQPQLERSIEALLELVKLEEARVGRQNVLIGGFGQGFAVAAAALIVDGRGDFGGLIGLNGWLPYSKQLLRENAGQRISDWVMGAQALFNPSTHLLPTVQPVTVNGGGVPPVWRRAICGIVQKNTASEPITPLYLAHPHYDTVVPCVEMSYASDVFRAMGWDDQADWEDYGDITADNQQVHWINLPRGFDDLCRWLKTGIRNCGTHPPKGHLNALNAVHSLLSTAPQAVQTAVRAWLQGTW